MVDEQDFIELRLRFGERGSCVMRLIVLLFLPLVIFLAVIGGYLGLIALKTEIHSVILIGIIFVIFMFFIGHNAYYSACRFRQRFEQMREELTTYINNNLLSIGELSKANTPFDTFMRQFSRSLRNENFSSVAAGLFPTLGILGTFISIALSMPDFSSQTSEALEQEISLLLGGVGTAFYVSIYGIFLSIWWIFFEKTGVSRFERDVLLIEESTAHLFWKKEEIEQTYFQKSMENFDKLNNVFDNISSHELMEGINKTLAQRLDIFDSVIMKETDVVEKAAQQIQRSAEETEAAFNARRDLFETHHAVQKSIEAFTGRLEENTQQLVQLHEALSLRESKSELLLQRIEKQISVLNDTMSTIGAENVRNVYSGVVQNLETMRTEIDRIGNRFEGHLDKYDEKFQEKIEKTLRTIDSETSQIVRQLGRLKDDENV